MNKFLTKEQVNRFIQKWDGMPYIDIGALDAAFGDYGPQEVVNTLKKYAELVEILATSEGRLWKCFCGVVMDDMGPVIHDSSCPVLRAKKLRGYE